MRFFPPTLGVCWAMLNFVKICTGIVKDLLDSRAKSDSSDEKASVSLSVTGEDSGLIHQTIYHALLDQSSLEAKGKRAPDMQELIDESILFLSAGTDTSSFTLTMAVYNILRNPEIMQKLQQELAELKEQCGGQPPSLKAIEKLPYLVSCNHRFHLRMNVLMLSNKHRPE